MWTRLMRKPVKRWKHSNSRICCVMKLTRWPVCWRLTPVRVVRKVRTGHLCWCVCICAMLKRTVTRLLSPTFRKGMRQESKPVPSILREISLMVIWKERTVFTVWCVFLRTMRKASAWHRLLPCSSLRWWTTVSKWIFCLPAFHGIHSEAVVPVVRTLIR